MVLKEGDKAPDFNAKDQNGNEVKLASEWFSILS
jgi:peroxiredoxin